MRCFTWKVGVDQYAGLDMDLDPELGLVLRLGQRGRYAWEARVKLDRQRPPPMEGQRVLEAGLNEFRIKDKKLASLVVSSEDDSGALLRVETRGAGKVRIGHGVTIGAFGDCRPGIRGCGTFGRGSSWEDILWVLSLGSAVSAVTPGEDNQVAHYLEEGKVVVYTQDAWEYDVLPELLRGLSGDARNSERLRLITRGHVGLVARLDAEGVFGGLHNPHPGTLGQADHGGHSLLSEAFGGHAGRGWVFREGGDARRPAHADCLVGRGSYALQDFCCQGEGGAARYPAEGEASLLR